MRFQQKLKKKILIKKRKNQVQFQIGLLLWNDKISS